MSSLLHKGIQVHNFKTAHSLHVSWIASAWVHVYVYVLLELLPKALRP